MRILSSTSELVEWIARIAATVQPLAYFARDLFKDSSSCFFPSGVHSFSGSSGRCMQIFSLIAIKSPLSFWKRGTHRKGNKKGEAVASPV
jgi:hypothetical protein